MGNLAQVLGKKTATRSILGVVAACAIAFGANAQAQPQPRTTQADMPGLQNFQAAPVAPGSARAIIEGRREPRTPVTRSAPTAKAAPSSLPPQSLSAMNTVQAPGSIAELARALKNDPDLIYQYVYQNIEYTPQYGALKGPIGTILDGRGNAFDQSALMVALLRQAGFTASYILGEIRLTPAQIAGWLDIDNSDACRVATLLGSGGVPVSVSTSDNTCSGTLVSADITHVWVKVNIGGTNYVFDPSFKTYTAIAGIDLASAMGYSQSTLLNNAKTGTTQTADYIQNVNGASLRNTLTGYANSLVSYIGTNNPSASLAEIIGGRTINEVTAPVRQTSLPYQKPGGTLTEWATDIPVAYKTSLRVRYPGIDQTFYADEIYSKRLTIFSNGSNQPVLRLDGAVVATGTALTPGSAQTITIDIDHPYAANGGTYGDASNRPISVTAGGSYFIVNGWDHTGRGMIEYHRRKLQENRAVTGATDTGEPVLGESLAVITYTWLAETAKARLISDQVSGMVSITHHVVGVVAQTTAPYIDLPVAGGSFIAKLGGAIAAEKETAAFFNAGGLSSAIEWAAVEQSLPAGAVSTIKLLDIANTQGDRIFDANSTNWFGVGGVRDIIDGQGYGASQLNSYEASINAGGRVLLPEHGNLTQGSWTGSTALVINGAGTSIGYLIGGNLKGGYTSAPLPPPTVNFAVSAPPPPPLFLGGDSKCVVCSLDPIDMFTGDFLYAHDDLTVGSGGHPFGLGFQRTYNSGARLKAGPMGLGGSHNFNVEAIVGSDPFQGLGEDSPIDAAAAIASLYASFDLLRGTKTLDRVIIATLIQRWFMDQLIGNAVTIAQPQNTQQFIKLADGSYNAPPSVASTLTQPSGLFSYKAKDGTILDFNSDKKIATWKNANNVTVTFSYTSGKLATVTNGLGRTLSLTYSGERISQVSDGTRSVTYGYDANGSLTSFTNTDSKVTTFQYDLPGRLTQIFYPAFPSTAFVTNEYDSLGRVKTQTNANLRTYQYFFAGFRAEEIDPLNGSHVWFYNPRRKVLKEVNQVGQVMTHTYDGRDRVTKTTMPEGNTVEYTYDARHNPLTITAKPKPPSADPAIVQSFTYEAAFSKATTATDPLGRVTSFTINATNGNLERIDQPQVGGLTPSTILTYNSRGQVLTVTDPTGKVTESTYDATTAHLLTSTEDKGTGRLNLLTQFGYDGAGNVTSRIDPNGRTTVIAYDSLRRVNQTTAPSPFSFLTKFTYNANDNLTKVERQTNDALAPWQVTTAVYNAAGKKTSDADPSGFVTTYEYDELERLKKVTDPELRATQAVYDAAGRVFRVIDPLGQTQVEYAYTPNGKRASLKDAELNTTAYTYDAFDRLSRQTFVDASFESFTYDAAGNLLTKSNRAGQSTIFTYDPLNRLSTKAPASQPTVTTTYDLAGRVLTVADSAGTFAYGYDTAGRNISVTRPDSKVVSYQYDANSNRTRLTWPDAVFVTYSYDELNRMKELRQGGTTLLAKYDWDALSRRAKITYGNATTASYSYKPNDDLATIIHQLKTSAVTFTYNYNQAHQRTQTAVTDDRFLFRPAANETVDYAANALNQYTLVNNAALTYDTKGNLTGDGVGSFTYDTENRMTGATVPGKVATYDYEPMGWRKSKTVNGATTAYLHDRGREIAEYSGAGSLLRRYVYGVRLDEPLVQITAAGTKFYYRADGLGSIVANEEHSSSFVQRFSYGPFGESTSATGHPYRYAARRIDEETGLYYFRARMYSPALGRFMQADPIGYQGGINLYAYVRNDPTNLVDPTGLAPGDSYPSADAAATAALMEALPLQESTKLEHAGRIYQSPDIGFSYTAPRSITETCCKNFSKPGDVPAGTTNAGIYHTHPPPADPTAEFSLEDRRFFTNEQQPGYVAGSDRTISKFTPSDTLVNGLYQNLGTVGPGGYVPAPSYDPTKQPIRTPPGGWSDSDPIRDYNNGDGNLYSRSASSGGGGSGGK